LVVGAVDHDERRVWARPGAPPVEPAGDAVAEGVVHVDGPLEAFAVVQIRDVQTGEGGMMNRA
jgi:hypothetical protein